VGSCTVHLSLPQIEPVVGEGIGRLARLSDARHPVLIVIRERRCRRSVEFDLGTRPVVVVEVGLGVTPQRRRRNSGEPRTPAGICSKSGRFAGILVY
jgi:hypothetical protein